MWWPSWFAGRWMNTPTQLIFTRHTSRISKTYICTVGRGDVDVMVNPCGKVRGNCTVTIARAMKEFSVSIKGVCIVRRRQYSNAWTTRVSLSTKRCGTTLIARRSTSNAISKRLIFHRTVLYVAIVGTTHSVERERGLQRSGLRACAVIRHRWRRRQAGGIHDDASKHHQRYRRTSLCCRPTNVFWTN